MCFFRHISITEMRYLNENRPLDNLYKYYFLVIFYELPCEIPPAKTAPAWTIGPSFPQARPPTTARMIPDIFTNKVFRRITRGTFTPFRKHFIWGIPEPAATGAIYAHKQPAIKTQTRVSLFKNLGGKICGKSSLRVIKIIVENIFWK